MEISVDHQNAKKDSYWENLVGGDTSSYKESVIKRLLESHFPKTADNLLDVGCGTCEILFELGDRLKSKSLSCLDYDPKVIDFLKMKYANKNVNWIVADIFKLGEVSQEFNLIFLLDMIHEVYSFYGRPDKNMSTVIDHRLGTEFTALALKQVASITAKGGGIIITDNVLCEETNLVKVRTKSEIALETVRFLQKDYPSRHFQIQWLNETTFTIPARELCILLTQYNKPKAKNWDRWNVEKMEIHQYMSVAEYRTAFDELGFDLHFETGTPTTAKGEWLEDFEILEGLNDYPDKRITLLAIKR